MRNPFRKRWEVYTVLAGTNTEWPVEDRLVTLFRFWTREDAQRFAWYGNSTYGKIRLEYKVRKR